MGEDVNEIEILSDSDGRTAQRVESATVARSGKQAGRKVSSSPRKKARTLGKIVVLWKCSSLTGYASDQTESRHIKTPAAAASEER